MNFVFDFGGVVFRWRPTVLVAKTLPERVHGELEAQRWADAIFQSYGGEWGEFDKGLVSLSALVQRIAQRTGLTEVEVQAVADGVYDELQPIAASVALVQALKGAGHRLFFLSNMPAPYADHLERSYEIRRWFDDGVFSSRVKLGKPDPAIFELALQRFGAAAGDCVLLDDHPANIAAARHAGWHAVHFVDAEQALDDMRRCGWCEAHSGIGGAR